MYTYKAKIVRVVDGDTIDLDVDLGFKIHSHIRTRLARIDTPEMNTEEGKAVKVLVETRLPRDTEVMIATGKGDRYGRWIAEISTASGLNVSDWLLAAGHAKSYP